MYSARLVQFGVPASLIKDLLVPNLNFWIDNMHREQPHVQSPAAAADRPTSTIFDDDVDDNNDIEQTTHDAKRLLKKVHRDLSTPANMAKYPLPALSLEGDNSLIRSVQHLNEFYKQPTYRPLIPLVSRVYSLAGTSAIVEQAFSSSGRVDSPSRNRLDPITVEQLTGKSL